MWSLQQTKAEMKADAKQTMKSEWLYKAGTQCELNSRTES